MSEIGVFPSKNYIADIQNVQLRTPEIESSIHMNGKSEVICPRKNDVVDI